MGGGKNPSHPTPLPTRELTVSGEQPNQHSQWECEMGKWQEGSSEALRTLAVASWHRSAGWRLYLQCVGCTGPYFLVLSSSSGVSDIIKRCLQKRKPSFVQTGEDQDQPHPPSSLGPQGVPRLPGQMQPLSHGEPPDFCIKL